MSESNKPLTIAAPSVVALASTLARRTLARRARVRDVHRNWLMSSDASATAPASPLVVAADGTGHHTEIAAALETAAPGATIVVRPGTYQGLLRISKPVILIGEGGRDLIKVVVDPAKDGWSSAITIGADSVISGMSVAVLHSHEEAMTSDPWGDPPLGPAVQVDSTRRVLIEDCDLSGAMAGVIVGWARSSASGQLVLRSCEIHDAHYGVFFSATARLASANLEDCHFTDNLAGIWVYPGSDLPNLAVNRCFFAGNHIGLGSNFPFGGGISDTVFSANRVDLKGFEGQSTGCAHLGTSPTDV